MKNLFASVDIPEKDRHLTGKDKLVALSFGVLIVLLGGALVVEGVSGIDHDDGIYVITAKAIAQGDGYRLIHLPDSPVQTKYPFLYPAILAIIWKLFPSFPGNLIWMQWLSLLSGAAAAALIHLYLIRFGYCSRGTAAAAVLLCATLPAFLFLCTSCMSEMPFALLLLLALWALEKHIETPFISRKAQLFLGVLLALPLLCRIIGFVLVLLVLLLALRNRKIMRWPAIGTFLVTLPFVIWLLTFSTWANAVTSNAYYTNYVSWWHSYGIPFLGRVLASNAFSLLYASSLISQIHWPGAPLLIWWGAGLIGLAGLITIVRHAGRWKLLPLLLVAYVAVVLVWPWPPFRFLVPVLPFLLAYSIMAIISVFKNRLPILKPAGFFLLGVMLLANAIEVRSDVISSRENHYPAYMVSWGSVPVAWSSYEDMFRWIKQHSSPDDVFVAAMDPMVYLYTGRRAFRPFASRPVSMYYNDSAPPLGSLSEIMANMKPYKPRYLVLSPMSGFLEEIPYAQFVVDLQKAYPGMLERVYLGKDKRFVIWKISAQ